MHRRQLENHRRKLHDIRNIMGSMKTLAAIETHKLDRYIASQQRLVDGIEDIAADFLLFYPQNFPDASPATEVIIVIGSERGFCGDFNERLAEALDQHFKETDQEAAEVVFVGSKLEPLLQTGIDRKTFIPGADVVEEIDSVLDSLINSLTARRQASSLCVLHHGNESGGISSSVLLPPFAEAPIEPARYSTPPLLNLPIMDFYLQLIDHYIFAALHGILHVSLMAENQQRIQHLERATRHLDDRTDELGHRINALRQEEIIEEIEVILLNAATGSP